MNRSQKITLNALSVLAMLALTACGGRAPGLAADQPSALPSEAPAATNSAYDSPAAAPTYPTPDPYASHPQLPIATQPVTGMANPPAGSFMVDQGNVVYGWRARGIAVNGGAIYIAAVDNDGLTKNGTVLKMDSTSGQSWKDLSTSVLGLSSKLSTTLQSVAIAGGNLFALDGTAGLYSLSTSGGNVKEIKGAGGLDIAGSNSGLFVAANGMLERSDMSGMSRSPMMGIPASAGIGTDSRGNLFFIAGNRVGLVDSVTGQARDLVSMGLNGPIDVAADGRNGDVYVLDGPEVKRFDTTGQMAAKFTHGAVQATSIAVDESGNVYVADYGTSSSDSKILKFGAVGTGLNNGMMGAPMGYSQQQYAQQPQAYAQQGAYTQQQAYPQSQAQYGAYHTAPRYQAPTTYAQPVQYPATQQQSTRRY